MGLEEIIPTYRKRQIGIRVHDIYKTVGDYETAIKFLIGHIPLRNIAEYEYAEKILKKEANLP